MFFLLLLLGLPSMANGDSPRAMDFTDQILQSNTMARAANSVQLVFLEALGADGKFASSLCHNIEESIYRMNVDIYMIAKYEAKPDAQLKSLTDGLKLTDCKDYNFKSIWVKILPEGGWISTKQTDNQKFLEALIGDLQFEAVGIHSSKENWQLYFGAQYKLPDTFGAKVKGLWYSTPFNSTQSMHDFTAFGGFTTPIAKLYQHGDKATTNPHNLNCYIPTEEPQKLDTTNRRIIGGNIFAVSNSNVTTPPPPASTSTAKPTTTVTSKPTTSTAKPTTTVTSKPTTSTAKPTTTVTSKPTTSTAKPTTTVTSKPTTSTAKPTTTVTSKPTTSTAKPTTTVTTKPTTSTAKPTTTVTPKPATSTAKPTTTVTQTATSTAKLTTTVTQTPTSTAKLTTTVTPKSNPDSPGVLLEKAIDLGSQNLTSIQMSDLAGIYSLAFIEVVGGPAGKMVPSLCDNVKAAIRHMHVDIYVTPKYSDPNNGKIVMQRLESEIKKDCSQLNFKSIWIKILPTHGWESLNTTRSHTDNTNFLKAVLSGISDFESVGIHISKEDSDLFFGVGFDYTSLARNIKGLWYTSTNDSPASMEDFSVFGGFKSAIVKQYEHNVTLEDNCLANRNVWVRSKEPSTVDDGYVPIVGGNILTVSTNPKS